MNWRRRSDFIFKCGGWNECAQKSGAELVFNESGYIPDEGMWVSAYTGEDEDEAGKYQVTGVLKRTRWLKFAANSKGRLYTTVS